MSHTPIADHALLSDRHSAALVDTAGSVDWLCFPRFDSPSVLRPAARRRRRALADPPGRRVDAATRRYLDRTLVLETTFTTAHRHARAHRRAGARARTTAATGSARRARTCWSAGSPAPPAQVEVEVDYRPRPEYGLIVPLLPHVDGGVTARGGAEWLVLTSPVDARPRRRRRRAGACTCARARRSTSRCTGRRSRRRRPASGRRTSSPTRSTPPSTAWRSVVATCTRPTTARGRDLVHHSGRVLQALSFQPSGAIVAAADHLAARERRRRAQLGLPLLLGARRQLHHGGAVGRRLPRRGRRLLRVHDHRRGRRGRPGHRRCRSCSASAASTT